MTNKIMGSEREQEPMMSTPRLPLFSNTSKSNSYAHERGWPEQSGMLTPPHYTLASVPFRWEEEPGKPRGCSSSSSSSGPIDFRRGLELPPRLLSVDANNFTKLLSPTTVLEGPYIGRSRFQSSSFRIIKREFYGSFRKKSWSPEREHYQEILGHPSVKRGGKEKGFIGSWGGWGRKAVDKGKSEAVVGGGSCVFPSSVDREADGCCNEQEKHEEEDSSGKKMKMTKIRRTGSFSTLSHSTKSKFWATIYESLKQVAPWRTGKSKKDRF